MCPNFWLVLYVFQNRECSRVARPKVATVIEYWQCLLWQVQVSWKRSNLSMFISKCTKFMHLAVEIPFLLLGKDISGPPYWLWAKPPMSSNPRNFPGQQWDVDLAWHNDSGPDKSWFMLSHTQMWKRINGVVVPQSHCWDFLNPKSRVNKCRILNRIQGGKFAKF